MKAERNLSATTGLELFEAGLVQEVPQDEFGSPIVFEGEACEATTAEIRVRKLRKLSHSDPGN